MINSLWADTAKLPSFPSLEQDLKTDILIVGGGMAGLLCACALNRACADYALIEADSICSGVTRNTTAKITSQHGLIYDKLICEYDEETARLYYEANQAAISHFRKLAAEYPCQMETKSAFVYTTGDTEKLEKELRALERIGAKGRYWDSLPLPFEVTGAIEFEDQAQFHPLLLAAGIAPGLRIYEHTPARGFEGNTVYTDKVRIEAKKILIATHFPIINKHGGYFLKLYQDRSYVLALENAPDPAGMFIGEVMRDSTDHAITICGMENVDPVGVHTGDSIVVAPIMTLNEHDLKMLNDSAIKIIRELKIEGGCNVQFALNPESSEYYLIEVNPRVSRSSALASKASGYPIAKVTAKIAMGMTLEEIGIANTNAAKEPSLDYVVAKLPRFPFDKFASAPNTLGTQMKATGEVMGIGSNLEECLLKSVRSLEIGACHFHLPKFDGKSEAELLEYISQFRDDNIFAIAQLLRMGVSVEKIHDVTKITAYFLESVKKIVDMEKALKDNAGNTEALLAAKKMGFSDEFIAHLWNMTELEVFALRKENKMFPVYKMVDTFHTGAYIPYFYSSYTGENASVVTDKKKIIVLGAGPIRIGQGVEFDYSTVHAVSTIKKSGYEAIIINNNPETVSTDYTTSDKLYFEPLTPEDVMNIIELEHPEGVIASLGGQTAINLAEPLRDRGVKIIGTDCDAIERAENRDSFEKILEELQIPQPKGKAVTNIEDGCAAAAEIGYPVLVRPSFVLGGRAMQIVANENQLRQYLKTAVELGEDKPVLVDKYIAGKEVEVDAICDGRNVFVPGIMELVERTGIHSGDSISVYPTFSISNKVKGTILQYAKKLGLGIGIIGLYNIQFIVDKNDDVYIIEVNPRSSRTVPFLSKSTGYSLADIATEVILGKSLKEQGIFDIYPEEKKRWYVKVPVFSFNKIHGLDSYLSPEMKSTGEAIGYDDKLNRALYKALQASGMHLQNYGTVFATIADKDKEEALPLIRRFYNLGFNIEATEGTAKFLKANGIRTHILKKLSDGSEEIRDALRQGHIAYVINTRDIGSIGQENDGQLIRNYATENGVNVFTALDTVKVLLDVLEETTLCISTIDS